MASQEKVTFIADVHGDNVALKDSLVHAGVAKRTRTGIKILHSELIVQTGDIVDRGNENLAVCDTLLEIMDQTRVDLLAGNHDLMMILALQNPADQHRVWDWVINGGDTLLREVAKKYNLRVKNPTADKPWGTNALGLAARDMIDMKWDANVQKRRMNRYDFPAALEKTIELFMRGQYAKIFDSMQIMSDAHPSIRAVHAGLDASWSSIPVEVANRHYKQCHTKKELHIIESPQRPALAGSIVWMRAKEHVDKKLLSQETAENLKTRDVSVVIHGHDLLRSGMQTLTDNYGIAVINGDTAMSKGYAKASPSRWAYVQAREDGSIVAESSVMNGARDFGRIENGQYIPPIVT